MRVRNWCAVAIAVVFAVLMLWPCSVISAEEQSVVLRAILISAQNEPAAQDPRLEFVEYKLRRVLGFEYYKWLGERSAVVNAGTDVRLDLQDRHVLRVFVRETGKHVRLDVQWYRGDELVVSTTVRAERRTPVVLGGINEGGRTLIVTLTAE